MPDGILSPRGRRLVDTPPAAEYLLERVIRAPDRWHPASDPDGHVELCTAENTLLAAELAEALGRVGSPPTAVLGYDVMTGSAVFRERLAAFMGRSFLGRVFRPEQIAVLAGAGSVLEVLFYTLAGPGEGVLVPTPGYPGFWPDLETRDGIRIIPVPRTPDDDYRLTPVMLDAAVAASPVPVRALLYTSPDNPLGRVVTAGEVEEVWAWADRNRLHVVFDEIYALSVFGSEPFVSAASVRPHLGERAHVVWAFSKDFGASGLRCGVLVSENEEVVAAVDGLAYWAAVSGDTQYRLGELIGDAAWVDGYVAENRRRLAAAYAEVTGALDRHRIPYVPAAAGIFFLVDLRDDLGEPTWESERSLWRRLLDEGDVNLTPGAACRAPEPGFMRLCYAKEPTPAVLRGIERIAAVLGR
jgi:aspartate/methionine/tyrosine aminotransferase